MLLNERAPHVFIFCTGTYSRHLYSNHIYYLAGRHAYDRTGHRTDVVRQTSPGHVFKMQKLYPIPSLTIRISITTQIIDKK